MHGLGGGGAIAAVPRQKSPTGWCCASRLVAPVVLQEVWLCVVLVCGCGGGPTAYQASVNTNCFGKSLPHYSRALPRTALLVLLAHINARGKRLDGCCGATPLRQLTNSPRDVAPCALSPPHVQCTSRRYLCTNAISHSQHRRWPEK